MDSESTWETRDLPILRVLVEHFDNSDTPIPVEEIVTLAGLSLTTSREGLRSIGRANPPYIEYMHDGTEDPYPTLITGITTRAGVTVEEVQASLEAPSRRLSFDSLDETEFEEFCFDLVVDLGFVNVDWRKGTGLQSSPADRGRDLVAQLRRTDVDKSEQLETWFIDCKHYKRGVPPQALQNLLAWAHAERPHTALVIASGFLSNPAKDYLKRYEETNTPPFRIKYWERPILQRVTRGKEDLLSKYVLRGMRTQSEILEAEQEFHDKVWYVRKLILLEAIEDGRAKPLAQDLERRMHSAMAEVRKRYGDDQVGPWDDFEWGMVHGKLSTLRWVLGDEWDFLDT